MSAAAHAEGWSAAFRLARRESREGLKGFRVFAFALFLGVAALAAIGSLSAAFQQGLQDEKRQLLGGDAEIASIEGALPADVQSFLAARGRVSHIVGAQLMARASQGNARTVVQLKAVDGAYPLIGAVALTGGVGALSDALAPKPSADGEIWGAVADQTLLDKLGIQIGGRVIIGQATFEIRAALSDEPDRASAGFMLGPRLIASEDAARATGLLDTSALVNNAYRIVLSNRSPSDFAAAFNEAYPNKGWRVRTAAEAARGLERLMRNLNVFLTMVGLSALVIGGVGASNAVGAYLRRKTPVIATLKCLGATGGLILKTYLAQILAVALMSVALGLVTGALAPFAAKATFGSLLPFDAALGLYPAALGEAAGFGVLAALAFAFWPLGEASRAPAATLFRSIVETKNSRAPLRDYIIAAGLAAVFVGLAIFLSEDRKFAIVLAASSIFAYFVLRLIAWGAVSLARRFWRPRRAAFRIAAAYLTRPGAATASVSVSLGLGLTLLAIVSLIDVNLTRDIRKALPQRAPALFFADIPYGDAAKFDARMKALANGAEFERYYMMRAGV
ncbi:MAG TPA: FtsX-like permease family protein, partial [Parvularculaceae bacterium]|nr:FtsX-like permease family protein [Parvularculaceae bacterium]